MMADYKKIFAKLAEKWPAKVLSVLAAIFLFTFHRISDLQERYFSVPLNLDIAANLIPGSNYPNNIHVTIRGTNNIYHISENDIEALLDLSKYSEPGIYKAQVQIIRNRSAVETEILGITADPSEISLELDTRMSKSIPVSPSFHGYLEPGFEMVSYSMDPNQVLIDGPEKLLQTISLVNTDFIDLRGRNEDFTIQVRIINPNQLFRIRGDLITEFKGFIKELIIINNLENLPITVIGLDDSLEAELNPAAASVKIQGVQSVLENISMDMVSVIVDCSTITGTGTYELPLLAEVEKELQIERIEPEIIKVEIKQKEEQ